MQDRPIITLTTDFGYDDPFVGVMKGVILKINPNVEIVDITHGIRPQNIKEAAFTISANYRFFPDDTIHVVVVDPGVGSLRRPIMLLTGHHYFIGPDNGVFTLICTAQHEILEVVHITSDHYFLSSHSPTFQGRDVFAPIAAWLSRGVAMEKFGDPVTDYQTIDLPVPVIDGDGVLRGEVIHIDRFGNAMTNIAKADLEKIVKGDPSCVPMVMYKGREVSLQKFYSDTGAGPLRALVNSSDFLELFVYMGSAASEYGITAGDAVTVLPL